MDLELYEQKRKEKLLKLRQLRNHIKLLFTGKRTPKSYKSKRTINQTIIPKEYKQKLKHRLNHYRQQQKRITLLYLKNCNEELSTIKIFEPLPTYSLSYLLNAKIVLKVNIYSINYAPVAQLG